jgi:K+-sensing histidine kinase KdpD
MIKAPEIRDEINRLLNLVDYQILDTPPEDDYNAFVELAAKICNVPIALISLIDDKRQWFKAKKGILESETSRDISFCGHAIADQKLMIVKDASLDDRFFDNPLVTGGPRLKFYAGAQLVTPSGQAIGTLCVADSKPGDLTSDQEKFLTILSQQVMTMLEYRRALISMKNTLEQFKTLIGEISTKELDQYEGKRETLSHLASGVAHEINNPLAIIMGTVKMLKKNPTSSSSPEFVEGLSVIEETILRVAGVVTELQRLDQASLEIFSDGKTIERAFSNAVMSRNTKQK